MTQEEGNKLIAEFLGGVACKINVKSIGLMDGYEIGDNKFPVDELEYHSSWNLLMPVVEKIESLNCKVIIDKDYVVIHEESYGRRNLEQIGINVSYTQSKTKIEGVFIAATQFIKWYNEFNSQKK